MTRDDRLAIAAYRAYHGRRGKPLPSPTEWQMKIWREVALAVLAAAQDPHK